MKQAYCSECGGYVALDAADLCPGGHARSCYRDAREVGVGSTGAHDDPASTGRVRREPAPARSPKRPQWLLPLAVVLGVGLVVASLGWVVWRSVLSPSHPASIQASSTSTATAEIIPEEPEPTAIRANADGSYPPALAKNAKYSRPSQRQQRWALATCGILIEANGQSHDLLGGASRTQRNVGIAKQVLSQQWSTRSRGDLLAQLSWIEKGGHRQDFNTITYALSVATPAQLSELRSQAEENPGLANAVDVAEQNGGRLGSKSIAGWDYARYVFLCRLGYLVGYLTEDEAWRRIIPAARVMQATFSSWRDLGDNYLIGRRFWSVEETKQSGAKMRQAELHLLSDSQSPWVQLPWRLELTTR